MEPSLLTSSHLQQELHWRSVKTSMRSWRCHWDVRAFRLKTLGNPKHKKCHVAREEGGYVCLHQLNQPYSGLLSLWPTVAQTSSSRPCFHAASSVVQSSVPHDCLLSLWMSQSLFGHEPQSKLRLVRSQKPG